MKLRAPQLCWHGDTELELEFPGSWDVSLCAMRGHHSPRLTQEEFRHAFNHPIGSAPIREVAQGKKEVALLFDDMSRPTRAAQLLPYILHELEMAGIPDLDLIIVDQEINGLWTLSPEENPVKASIFHRRGEMASRIAH